MARSRKSTEKAAAGKRPIEQYQYQTHRRKNNPPVGLVTPDSDREAPKKQYTYDPHLDPTLTWARKAEHTSFELPTVSLMTAVFDYYELAHPAEGVGSGFKYKTVPHVTLKSIANNEPPGQETLYDQPKIDNAKVRVTGPFTVEAVPAPTVRPVSENGEPHPADTSVARSARRCARPSGGRSCSRPAFAARTTR